MIQKGRMSGRLEQIWAEGPVSLITHIMWGVLALAAIGVLLQHKFAVHSVCISLWLLLISAVPASWMALGYHDVQVQGLLRDGLLGAAHMKAQGGRVITEAESSCVVYGMPRVVAEAALSDRVAPLDEMARTIMEMV